jgi:glutamyl-tRNA reductase
VLREVKSKLLEIPISPILLSGLPVASMKGSDHQEKVQKVINNLATRMRRDYTPGCHYIQAINDFIAL